MTNYVIQRYEYLNVHSEDFVVGINKMWENGWKLHSWKQIAHWGNSGPYVVAVFEPRTS